MEICNGSWPSEHEEVCYDSRICPVCDAKKEISQLEDTVEELKTQVGELEDKVSEAMDRG